jgi:hypothetical protein
MQVNESGFASHARKVQLLEQAKDKVLRLAKQARRNSRDFFSFVVREETSRERIECLPFQRVVFKFVEHFDRCVIRLPVGFSKSYMMAGLSMYLLGKNATTRGVIISASQGQAQKPLSMVSDYIESSPELRLVYPELQQSPDIKDPWTQSRITVQRPQGIRDPSLAAVGFHAKLPGARLNWILVDDLLTEENTGTKEQILDVNRWFNSTVLSRRDIHGTKLVVTNTPWDPNDLTYTLEKAGWPTITMDIDGNIYLTNTCETDLVDGALLPAEGVFDCDDIRPSLVDFPDDEFVGDTKGKSYRLVAHDHPRYDPDQRHLPPERRTAEFVDRYDAVPLWPERYGRPEIERLRSDYRTAMAEYNQLYRCQCRSDEDSKVKVAWIEACKEEARKRDIFTFTAKWDPTTQGRTFTGVDLAVGKRKSNNRTSLFTFAVLPDQYRRILRIDSGRYDGSTVIDLLTMHFEAYGSIIRVENNAAQDFLRQWARERNKSLPIRGVPTGKNKSNKEHGVESMFIEIEGGIWLIPNDPIGGVHEAVQRWIDSMLYYDPNKHTGDELMSSWLAREQARQSGALSKPRPGQGGVAMVSAR